MPKRIVALAWLYQLLIFLGFVYLAAQTPLAQHLKNDSDFAVYLEKALTTPAVWLELGRFAVAILVIMYVKAVYAAAGSLAFQGKIRKRWLRPMPLVLTTLLLELWLIQLNSAIYPFSAYGWLRKSFLAEAPAGLFVGGILLALLITGLKSTWRAHLLPHLAAAGSAVALFVVFSVWPRSSTPEPVHHPDKRKPDIILLGIDSLRPDVLGINGFSPSITPNLDAILPTMQRFQNAWTPLARTHVAWMSMLTGQYPIHHKLRFNLTSPALITRPLATMQWLKSEGYKTLYAMDERRFNNIDQSYGFDDVIGPKIGVADFLLSTLSDMPTINLLSPYRAAKYLFPYVYQNRGQTKTYRPEIFSRNVLDAACRDPDKPLFLGLHLTLPHWPFTNRGMQDIPAHLDKFTPEYPYHYLYLLMTHMADAQLGDIYQGLKRCGRLENAIVFVISDHGENFPDDSDLVKNAIENAHFPVNSVGHGTSVANPQQNHVVLAVQKFKHGKPTLAPIDKAQPRILTDVMPSIVAWIGQGNVAEQFQFDGCPITSDCHKWIFMESSISPDALSGSRLNALQAIMESLSIYTVNREGHVIVKPDHYDQLVAAKKRAVLHDDWILVMYPDMPDDLILVHRKQMRWWPASVAPKEAPTNIMLQELCRFYRQDYGFNPNGLCTSFNTIE